MAVFEVLSDFETLADRKRPLPSSVFGFISATLRQFHEACFVHVDVRDVNIIVSRTNEKNFKNATRFTYAIFCRFDGRDCSSDPSWNCCVGY